MGKIKSYIQDFLEAGGYDLGYDWDKLPSRKLYFNDDLNEMDFIIKDHIAYNDYIKGIE